MNKRPGQIRVTTEVAFCPFCARTRTLRIEERQLGALIRTLVTCESCHRVLSSTVGVADAEAATPEEAAGATAEVEPKAAAAKPAAASKPKAAAPKPKTATPKAKATPKATRRTK